MSGYRMSSSELIFLTATVKVDAQNTRVRLTDPQDRIESIVQATQSWVKFAKFTNRDLILIENSGSLGLLRQHLPKETKQSITLIEAPRDKKSTKEGISAGEFEMIKFLMNHYPIEEYKFIWKISGRNFCPNAKKVLCWNGEADIMASRSSWPAHFVNTRLLGMKPEVWRDFIEYEVSFSLEEENRTANSFGSMEHFVTQFVLDQEVGHRRQVDFPQIPRFTGYSGSTNKIIDNNKRRLILAIVNPFRRIIVKLLIGMTP